MPTIVNAFAGFLSPGTKTVETTAGYRVIEIASHSTVYICGGGTIGDYNTPTLVRNVSDFTNQFGGSASEAAVRLLFRNDPEVTLYFTRAKILPQVSVLVTAFAAGPYTLTINGTAVTYTALAGGTKDDVVSGLVSAINASSVAAEVDASVSSTADTFIIRAGTVSATLTVVVTIGAVTRTVATHTSLLAADYVKSLESSFDVEEGWPQGFLLCPEAFQNLSLATDRYIVGSAMEAHCSNGAYDWVALVDAGEAITTVAALKTEGEFYSTPEGHTTFEAPYIKDLEGIFVPPSAGVAGIATRRYREQGYHQPIAGANYPMKGVADLAVRYSRTEQDVLNPVGINLVRYLRNKGFVVWGMRTRSGNSYYKFTTTRVIMDVLNGTLRDAFDFDLFTSIDGQGVLLNRLEETARSVCRRMWQGGAFYGQTEADAFAVICNRSNNPVDQLELGQVLIEVYAAPAPGLEKLLINTIRVNVGAVQASSAARQQVSATV